MADDGQEDETNRILEELSMPMKMPAPDTYSQGRIAGLMEAAGIVKKYQAILPKLCGPDYGMASKQDRALMRNSLLTAESAARIIASAIRALAEKEPPDVSQSYGIEPRSSRLARELPGAAAEKEPTMHVNKSLPGDVAERLRAQQESPPSLTPLERELLGALKAFVDGPEIIPDSSRFMGFRTNMDELRANARAILAKAEKKE